MMDGEGVTYPPTTVIHLTDDISQVVTYPPTTVVHLTDDIPQVVTYPPTIVVLLTDGGLDGGGDDIPTNMVPVWSHGARRVPALPCILYSDSVYRGKPLPFLVT